MTLTDEARGRREGDGARPRWALGWVHQFDLVRRTDGVRYLTRWWLVNTPWGGIAVHRMEGADARTTLHDHPFRFLSIVLRGGYIEDRLDPLTMRVAPRRVVGWNRMTTHDAHTITRLLRVPTWTLVFIGRKRRTWGFWEPPHGTVQRPTPRDGVMRVHDDTVPLLMPNPAWSWTEHTAFDSGHDLGTEVRR